MNSPLPAATPAQRRNWTRRLVNVLVALAVVAVAAAAFVFSYDGVHAIALLGGVSAQLARYYPGLFDAVLVIACVAAVVLRDGRWWARLWAWVVVIVVLAAIGTADVLHAMNYTLRHRPTEGIVAAAPVAAVLLAFSLLLTLLRQSRTHAQEPAGPGPLDLPALPAAVATAPIALPAAPATALPAPEIAPPADVAPDDVAPTRDYPVPSAPEAPASEVPTLELPIRKAPAVAATPGDEEPAPPTVAVPALPPELGPPPAAARAQGPAGIRYAGNGVPGMAGKRQAAEHAAAPGDEDWETEEAGQFAGLVYPAREDHRAPDDDAGDSADVDDRETDEPDEHASGKTPPEPDDDARPLATAPFAPAPGLNRVRSTPTPPADEDE